MTKQLILKPFFLALKREDYAIVKLPGVFPKFGFGSDLDIFCRDLNSVGRKIISKGINYLSRAREIKVSSVNKNQVHIDFCHNKMIELRFDLYGSLPAYKRAKVDVGFFDEVLDGAKKYDKPFIYKTANELDEGVIRYLEYLEYYETRPDKVKHLEFVLGNFKSRSKKEKLLTRLHEITKLPATKE